jgi:myo-inositol-1(or 4)-monophosphatase
LPAAELADDRPALAARLETAVRAAGAIALKAFRSPVKSWTKGFDSPVSEVDIAVDAFLRTELADPGIGWLSEETVDDRARLGFARVWIVDPIDGTRGYLAGKPDWSVAAALVENGRPIIGIVFAPADDQFYLATAGGGATLNGQPITASGGESLTAITAAGPKSYVHKGAPGLELEPKVHSLALRFARVADGTLDAAFSSGNSQDWDLAAADLLVHEAGGNLTTTDGQPLRYNREATIHPPLVAAGSRRHAALVERLIRAT